MHQCVTFYLFFFQDNHFLPPLHASSYSVDNGVGNGSVILPAYSRPQRGRGSFANSQIGSRSHQTTLNSKYPVLTDEEESDAKPADEDVRPPRGATEPDGTEKGESETTSSQVSDAASHNYEQTNGTLWPKPMANNILTQTERIRFSPPQTIIPKYCP